MENGSSNLSFQLMNCWLGNILSTHPSITRFRERYEEKEKKESEKEKKDRERGER